ncbi:hypothetical protein PATSB16_37420 [Pandoraea thiooxydans]|nr:hypothetical protein PATSB16_37420 [Pandoraea thiooxydans]
MNIGAVKYVARKQKIAYADGGTSSFRHAYNPSGRLGLSIGGA